METKKSKSTTLVFFIIWFTYVAVFGFITTVIRDNGYLNFEPSYITNHINTLFYEGELVKNFFLSYPLLTNILAYPFSIFSAEDAPFFASIFYTSLFTTIVVTIVGKNKNNIIKSLLFVYFLISPITIYTACSGTSLYAFYILYFFIFYYLFHYIKKFTTYHIAILSIILSLSIFLDHRILWIFLILFFYIFVFSVYGIKGLWTSSFIIKYIKITQHNSLRRKFRGHLFSMIFIIGFFPISGFILYLTINYLVGDNFFYFYENLESKWNANSFLSLIDTNTITILKKRAVNHYSFVHIIFFITPIYVFEIISHYKEGLKVFVLLLVPIFLFVLIKDRNLNFMSLSYYIVVIASGIASITVTQNKLFKSKMVSYLTYSLLFIISILGEYFYLEKSNFTSEQIFYQSIVNNTHNKTLQDYKNGGRFLAINTPINSIVLCDKSIMYPIIAYNKKNNFFIPNSSPDYKKAIINPQTNCNYIIVSNTSSPFYNYDKTETALKEQIQKKDGVKNYISETIFYCNTFRIIKILK